MKDDHESNWFEWKVRLAVAGVIVLVSVIGLGFTNLAKKDAEWYWILVFPLFLLVGVRIWDRNRSVGAIDGRLLLSQALHWLGFLMTVWLLFHLVSAGTLDRSGAGLVSLLMLALTSYLAGLHFDRIFLLVALLLALTALSAAYVQENMWLIMVISGLFLAALFLYRRTHRAYFSPTRDR